jgi:hypothetical protein
MGLKAVIRIAMNRVLNPMGFELRRFRYEGDSYTVSNDLIEHQIGLVAEQLQTINGFLLPVSDRSALETPIRQYYKLFQDRPVRQAAGGSGFNAGLILFVAARLAAPQLIVESGTFKGFSAWVFRQACPDAELHCFDLSFAELAWRDATIRYHKHDWMDRGNPNFTLPSTAQSLCFFDDHVSQAQRIIEAHERGFKRLIFDDNLPGHTLHRDGTPAVPTIDMLYDGTLRNGVTIEWVSFHKRWTYRHDAALAEDARQRIKRVAKAPSLYDETGYAPANLTFVELE